MAARRTRQERIKPLATTKGNPIPILKGKIMKPQLPVLYGDLIRSDEPVIAQGCNTQGIMGAGFALQIANTYPLVLNENKRAVAKRLFVPGSAQLVICNPKRSVFNLATQDDLGPHARYEWVYLAFRNMAERCVVEDIPRVAIPEIGCGIGGLAWPVVENEIYDALADIEARGHKLEIVRYVYEPRQPWQGAK
jgi:O-acetyl-ADP-ribose deacetylase (regulator of RNase III)